MHLLVDENRSTRRKPPTCQKSLKIVGFELTLVVIGTDCIGSCKSNYHTIMTTTAPYLDMNYVPEDWIWFDFWCLTSLGNISAISDMATRFSGGRNQSTQRKPPTMGKQLVSYHLWQRVKCTLFSSPCQRQCELLPSLGIRCLLSVNFQHFNLLLWNPPYELKLGRKVLYKDCSFCLDPLTNMAATGNSCFWLAFFLKSSLKKPLSQMNRKLVGSIYGRSSIKIANFISIC